MQAAPFLVFIRQDVLCLCLIAFALLWMQSATAFEQLSDAQKLIYDTPHLANTIADQQIRYRYTATNGTNGTNETIQDKVTLSIDEVLEENRRNVQLAFLTDERHLPLPPFSGYRGNPVIIAMLEHVAQTMAADTGGNTLYFRNRIRDALANETLTIKAGMASYNEQNVKTQSLSMSPFLNDTKLEDNSIYRNILFSIRFSDEVPAGVLDITVLAQLDDKTFNRSLSLE